MNNMKAAVSRILNQPRKKTPPDPSLYSVFPPPPPFSLIENKDKYEQFVLMKRKHKAPMHQEDNSLYTLYRLYEDIVLNYTPKMRNEIEFFFNQPDWPVSEIPDPRDQDPARYAVLACVTQLLVLAFNRKIGFGIPRGTSGINSKDEIEEIKKQPHVYEKAPEWAEKVPPIDETLKIPFENGQVIENFDDERASGIFKEKNILIWTPHIYFL
jgi:hypothetical protein